MKTQTKHRIRIVIAFVPVVFLLVTGLIADDIHDWTFKYSGAANRAFNRLQDWIVGDDLERWLGLWERRLADLNPDRITVDAVAKAMECSPETAQRLCNDATRAGFFAINNNDAATYKLVRPCGLRWKRTALFVCRETNETEKK